MLKSKTLSRRELMLAGAALPVVAAAGQTHAAAEMKGVNSTRFNRMKVGAFEVTTLLVATRPYDNPQSTFGMNVSPEEFAAASKAARIPSDKAVSFFTPTVLNTGSELILFDTGLNPEGVTGALEAAGYTADQVDAVVITHMHGDHIGGIAGDAGETFKNARYVTGTTEFDFWSKADNQTFDGKVRPLAEKFSFLEDGGSVASGVTAVSAFGHTPGHTVFRIESNGQQLVLGGDFANHPVWSVAFPDWEVRFDMDKAAAAKTRRKLLDMMAADDIPFVGYHMTFPGVGYVEAKGDGYHYVPASYQLMF